MCNVDCLVNKQTLSWHHGIHQSVYMPPADTPPVRTVNFSWHEHSTKLLPGIDDYTPETISQWSGEQVAQFVTQLPGCQHVGKTLMHEVQISVLLSIQKHVHLLEVWPLGLLRYVDVCFNFVCDSGRCCTFYPVCHTALMISI